MFTRRLSSCQSLNSAGAREGVDWKGYSPKIPQTKATRERLLAAARAVGDRLLFLSMRDEKKATWLELQRAGQHHWNLAPVGFSLYDGGGGIVFFLAYLGAITGDERYTDLARAGLNNVRQVFHELKELYTGIGAFHGWGSIVYLLSHLGRLWQAADLLDEAEELVALLPPLIKQDTNLDIISGAAGCLASLLSLYHARSSPQTLAAAVLCGERLLACARATPEGGVAWDTVEAKRPLAGFSHGVSGIGWALLELAAVTGQERFHNTAEASRVYETTTFSPEAGNWLDLRDHELFGQAVQDGDLAYMVAWCHGAPGVGLARARALRHVDGEQIRFELKTALETTFNHGFGLNHSLCHGDLGNLELLLEAAQLSGNDEWRQKRDLVAAMILESIDDHGWLTGVPNGVENPALMVGISGIGYGLLRLAAPERLPSVLVLDPPRSIPSSQEQA